MNKRTLQYQTPSISFPPAPTRTPNPLAPSPSRCQEVIGNIVPVLSHCTRHWPRTTLLHVFVAARIILVHISARFPALHRLQLAAHPVRMMSTHTRRSRAGSINKSSWGPFPVSTRWWLETRHMLSVMLLLLLLCLLRLPLQALVCDLFASLRPFG
jgi:hypothetical protein